MEAYAKAQPSSEAVAWSVEDSSALYNVEGWGKPYFHVNTAGRLCVCPHGNGNPPPPPPFSRVILEQLMYDYSSIECTMLRLGGDAIDVLEVVHVLEERGLQTPLLLRFPDIIGHRLRQLQVLKTTHTESDTQHQQSITSIVSSMSIKTGLQITNPSPNN